MKTAQTWDPQFMTRSPAFCALQGAAQGLDLARWPTAAALSAQARLLHPVPANAVKLPITFTHDEGYGDLAYEQRIHIKAEVLCRPRDWHDFLNALVWMSFPNAKAALNARHVLEMGRETPGRRGRARDALTLFDEGGVIVCCTDPNLLQLIREFRWKDLYWEHRQVFESSLRAFVFGHAMYHKLLDPFLGVTALALLFEVEADFPCMPTAAQVAIADGLAASTLRDPTALATPQALAPFPILGMPGWFAQNAQESFYDNQEYFRPGRARSRRPALEP